MVDMQPKVDDATVSLPITFDYSGGRAETRKHLWLQIGLVVVLTIFVLVLVFMANVTLPKKFVTAAVIVFCVQWFIRFFMAKEQMFSNAYETLKEVNFTPSTRTFWKIYDVDKMYPYIAHYTNGIKAIFVRLEKDVVVGKPDTIMFDHYNAIAEAYKQAGISQVNMIQVDYMDNVGNDPRLKEMYTELNNCNNQELKDLMLQMYSNLQEEMALNYACYDLYVFYTKGKEAQLWYNTQLILGCLLDGNYLSYKVLNLEGMRESCLATLNLDEFSAIEACANAFTISTYRGIVPIKVITADGEETKLNMTQEEKRQEMIRKQQEELAERERRANMTLTEKMGLNTQPKEQKQRKQKKNNNVKSVVEEDLFADTPLGESAKSVEEVVEEEVLPEYEGIYLDITGVVGSTEIKVDNSTETEIISEYDGEDTDVDIFEEEQDAEVEVDIFAEEEDEKNDEEVDIFDEGEEEIDIFAE